MAEEENNLIELTDEEGNVIKCALYDIIDFEDKQYAILGVKVYVQWNHRLVMFGKRLL